MNTSLRFWNLHLRQHPRHARLLLALLTLGVYGRSVGGGFVTDDGIQILSNPFVTNPQFWSRIFTGSVWSFLGANVGAEFYRPLQILSYWFLYQIAGPTPPAFHLFQLALYVGTVWLVYEVGRELLQHEPSAFFGAVLWAVHPLHVEAVAWIASLPEVGCGFFYVLGFWLYLRAEDKVGGHVVAALSLLASLLFKEMALSFPLLIVSWWLFFGRRDSWKKYLVNGIPYFAALVAYVLARKAVLGHIAQTYDIWISLPMRVGASLGLCGQYLRLFLWPAHLNPYRVFEIKASLLTAWPWLASLAFLAALCARKREPVLGFLVTWWFLALLPVLDLRQLTFSLLADRFTYLPSVGLCLAISSIAMFRLPERWPRGAWLPRLMLPGVMLLAVVWAIESYQTIPNWRDEETLISYSVQESPNAAALHVVQAMRLLYVTRDLDGAAREFQTALRLNQTSLRPIHRLDADCYVGLGEIASRRGRRGEALAYYEKAIRISPGWSPAYDALGAAYVAEGEYGKAAEYFSRAVKTNPQDLSARFYLGTCWMKLQRFRQAAEQFRAARVVEPSYREAYIAEARALEALGEFAEAARVLSMAPGR